MQRLLLNGGTGIFVPTARDIGRRQIDRPGGKGILKDLRGGHEDAWQLLLAKVIFCFVRSFEDLCRALGTKCLDVYEDPATKMNRR